LTAGCSGCNAPSPTVQVATAVEIGELHASSLVVGRDGAATVEAFGQEVWLFGDTFLSVQNVQGFNFVSNTFATSAFTDAGGVLSIGLLDRLDGAGAPDELLFPTATELAFDLAHVSFPDGGCSASPCDGRFATWPTAAVFDPNAGDGGAALVFYQLISAAPGSFNFSGIGQGVALWSDFNALPTRPELDLCDGGPTTALFCASEPGYGMAAVLVDGGVFAFACEQSGLSYPCQLASVPFAQALDKGAWQFWDGSAWSSNLTAAQTLFDGAPILSVFFNGYAGQWMVVYSKVFSNQVVFRTAPALTGPWSGEGNLFVADDGDGGGTAYDTHVHPELAEQGGRIQYLTYSRPNGTLFGDDFALWQVTFQTGP
jgi:hypothetical protein